MGPGAMGFKESPRRIADFYGVDRDVADRLAVEGVVRADQLLVAGHLPEDRAALAAATGLPLSTIRELVGLADLSRLEDIEPGLAYLLYAAGIRAVADLLAADPVVVGAQVAEINAEQRVITGDTVDWAGIIAKCQAGLRESPLPDMVAEARPEVEASDGSEVIHRDAAAGEEG